MNKVRSTELLVGEHNSCSTSRESMTRSNEGRERECRKLTVFTEESYHISIITPNDVLDERSSEFGNDLLLLNIEKDDRVGSRE